MSNKKSHLAYFNEDKLNELLKQVEAVIFDMDGLIVDNESLQLSATNRALSTYRFKINEDYWIRKCVGKRSKEFFQEIIEENSISLKESLEELVERKNSYYREYIENEVENIVRPGVKQFIQFLRENSYSLALATSAGKIETEAVIGKEGLGIEDKFQVIVTGEEVQKPKPDPEIYNKVVRKLKTSPEVCLVLEDTAIGVEAAKSARMKVIAVPNRFTLTQDFSRANLVITDLTEEAKIIKKEKISP